MKRALQLSSFLKHHMQAKLFFRMTPMSHEGIDFKDEYLNECYPDSEEYIDEKTSEAKDEYLHITVFMDTSRAKCLDTQQSVMWILIFLVSAPIFYYTERQNTAESSTYGSEIVAMKISIEHLLVIRYKLRMMGV